MRAGRTPRVLVIDDERHLRELLREMLERWGYLADTAASGGDGLVRFEAGGYDLVLTDFLMPGVSGLAVVEAVRRRDPAVGIVMLTASLDDLDADAERLGFILLRKPLHVGRLQTAVEAALGGGALMPAPVAADEPTGLPPRTPRQL